MKGTAMKKFVALYFAPRSAIEQFSKASPEQMKAGMERWMKWVKAHEKSLPDAGAPLGKTKRITPQGVSDTRNEITGYSIVQAESAEAAAKLFGSDHPHFMIPGGFVELIERVQIPEM